MNEANVIFIKPLGMKGERVFKTTLNNGKKSMKIFLGRETGQSVFLGGSHISLLKQLVFHLIVARSALQIVT